MARETRVYGQSTSSMEVSRREYKHRPLPSSLSFFLLPASFLLGHVLALECFLHSPDIPEILALRAGLVGSLSSLVLSVLHHTPAPAAVAVAIYAVSYICSTLICGTLCHRQRVNASFLNPLLPRACQRLYMSDIYISLMPCYCCAIQCSLRGMLGVERPSARVLCFSKARVCIH